MINPQTLFCEHCDEKGLEWDTQRSTEHTVVLQCPNCHAHIPFDLDLYPEGDFRDHRTQPHPPGLRHP